MKQRKKTSPRVSVIMPAHNATAFIKPAIESILNQTFKDFELIVVNDGSTDQTAGVVRGLAKTDSRIKLISYKHNKGESVAANIGFVQARGRYIARMDADDLSHPQRLEKQVAFLNKHPRFVVVGSQSWIIDEQSKIIGQKLFPLKHKQIYQEYGFLHPILHPSIMVRRSLLPWSDKLWANEGEPNDDYFTLFHLLSCGRFANLKQKLVSYRMHGNNKSLQNIKAKFINSSRIRFYAMKHLGYPFSGKMWFKLLTQAVFVLTLPEWVTVGCYLYFRGMKPFDKAFPTLVGLRGKLQFVPFAMRFKRVVSSLAIVFFSSVFTQK